MKKGYLKYEKDHGGREKYVRVDRRSDATSDCAIRALAIAMERDWKEVYKGLCEVGEELCRMPNSDVTIGLYLEREGWVKNKPHKVNGKTVIVREFPAEEGENYIVKTTSHLVAIKDKVIRDT